MKLFTISTLPFFATSENCDISDILQQQDDGKYDFGTYKLKFSNKRSYDNLQLTNKGQMKKKIAQFHHKNDQDFSDGWVTCNQAGHKTQFYLRCDQNGNLFVGANAPEGDLSGNSITLPDCSGCDSNQLGVFNINHDENCNKDNCFRYCDTKDRNHRTHKKIQCRCDWAANSCTYQTKKVGNPGWHEFVDSEEKKFDNCEQIASTEAPEPPTDEPEPEGEWSSWSDWTECSQSCDGGTRTRGRTCSVEGGCSGADTESESCNEEECPEGCDMADLPVHDDDIDGTTVWTCSNGALKNSICTKSCSSGYHLGGNKDETKCECTPSRCRWKGQVSPCEQNLCVFEGSQEIRNMWWPLRHGWAKCVTPSGEIHTPVDDLALPEGTVCSPHCPEMWVVRAGMSGGGSDSSAFTADSTCECTGNTCRYTSRKMRTCTRAVCGDVVPLNTFSIGFTHPDAAIENFNPAMVDCTERVPDDFEGEAPWNTHIAGRPVLGSQCSIECAEGFGFLPETHGIYTNYENGKLVINCVNGNFGVGWDLLQDSYGNYGDCMDEWTGQITDNCYEYPQCVPNSVLEDGDRRRRESYDFESFF